MYRKIERSLVAGDEHGVFIGNFFLPGQRAYVVDFNYHYLAMSRLWAQLWDESHSPQIGSRTAAHICRKEIRQRNIILLKSSAGTDGSGDRADRDRQDDKERGEKKE